MVFQLLVKTEEIEIDGRSYAVRYYEMRTARGVRRYSSEVVLAPGDRVILDGGSLSEVASRALRLAPATIYSRTLVARAA